MAAFLQPPSKALQDVMLHSRHRFAAQLQVMGVAPVMLHTHATAVVVRQLIYVLPLIATGQSSIDTHRRNVHSGTHGTLSLNNAKSDRQH